MNVKLEPEHDKIKSTLNIGTSIKLCENTKPEPKPDENETDSKKLKSTIDCTASKYLSEELRNIDKGNLKNQRNFMNIATNRQI